MAVTVRRVAYNITTQTFDASIHTILGLVRMLEQHDIKNYGLPVSEIAPRGTWDLANCKRLYTDGNMDGGIYVIEKDDYIVGMCLVQNSYLFQHGREIANVYIRPPYRSEGYGSRLLTYVIDNEQKLHPELQRFILNTHVGDLETWYNNFGFHTQEVIMHKVVTPTKKD